MQRLAKIHKRTGKTSAGLSAMQRKKPIQEMDLALFEWPASQSDRLHIAETAIPVWHKYCKDAELSMCRHRK